MPPPLKHLVKNNFVVQKQVFNLLSDEELEAYNTLLEDDNITVTKEKEIRIPGKPAVVGTNGNGDPVVLEPPTDDEIQCVVTFSIHKDILKKRKEKQDVTDSTIQPVSQPTKSGSNLIKQFKRSL